MQILYLLEFPRFVMPQRSDLFALLVLTIIKGSLLPCWNAILIIMMMKEGNVNKCYLDFFIITLIITLRIRLTTYWFLSLFLI